MLETTKLEIVTIPALEDNYFFLIHDPQTKQTALVDCGEAAPILSELKTRGWSLNEIWLTHHHYDHIQDVDVLVQATGAKVIGAHADINRLPPLAHSVKPQDTFHFGAHDVHVLAADGHTIGHIAFHIPSAQAVFSADSLMALGCGRLFEGTAAQMFATLSTFAALPEDTLVYSGHEYTASNAAFALTIDPGNIDLQNRARDIKAKRAANQATIPSLLSLELATNPFLRAHIPSLKRALGMTLASDLDVFTELRTRKDQF